MTSTCPAPSAHAELGSNHPHLRATDLHYEGTRGVLGDVEERLAPIEDNAAHLVVHVPRDGAIGIEGHLGAVGQRDRALLEL